jgi:hypothetical protein
VFGKRNGATLKRNIINHGKRVEDVGKKGILIISGIINSENLVDLKYPTIPLTTRG